MALRYVKRADLDAAKWDACIDGASNGLIYGYTFYLDALCTHWDALVLDDYAAVMPLPWRRKWGISYLYHPFAVAQLGVFGNRLSGELLHHFLKHIPTRYWHWDFPLNFGNRFSIPSFGLYERKNFILNLNHPYEGLQAGYRPHIRQNLKKAQAQNGVVQTQTDIDLVIALAQNHTANWGTATDYGQLKKLYEGLSQQGKAVIYSVSDAGANVLASAVFFFSHNRAYYILPGNHPAGRKWGASHLLIDTFIKDYAGRNLILDFEGSDVPGLQFFYSSFGAVEEPYAAIRCNRFGPLSPHGALKPDTLFT